VIFFSPLMSMVTSPEDTSFERAAMMNTASASTMAVNIPMPRMISVFIVSRSP